MHSLTHVVAEEAAQSAKESAGVGQKKAADVAGEAKEKAKETADEAKAKV